MESLTMLSTWQHGFPDSGRDVDPCCPNSRTTVLYSLESPSCHHRSTFRSEHAPVSEPHEKDVCSGYSGTRLLICVHELNKGQ